MMDKEIHYEFVNSQTGNVIAYLELPAALDEKEQTIKLDQKKAELATANQMNMELIYWQDKDHRIQ